MNEYANDIVMKSVTIVGYFRAEGSELFFLFTFIIARCSRSEQLNANFVM